MKSNKFVFLDFFKMKRLCLLLSVWCFHFDVLSQDNINNKAEVKVNKAYLKSYLLDTRDIISSPFKINKTQGLKMSGFALATGTLIWLGDKTINNFAKNNRTTFGDNFFRFGAEHWGDGIYSMPLMAGFYLAGKIAHNDRAVKTAMLGVKTFIITSLLVSVPKEFFHRQRPYAADNQWAFNGPFAGYGKAESRAFPSGHSMSAFAMATIVANEYNEYKIVPIVAYGLASLTAVSRVYFEKHWSSDILVGSAFGYAMAKLIHHKNNWNISPFYSKSTSGMTIRIPLN